jgi:hypothetical protein
MFMKNFLLTGIMLLFTTLLFAQQYPLVTIQDIQFVPDSLAHTDPPSPLNGDTVRIHGLVMVQPVIHPDTNRGVIISAGARWSIYVQDPQGGLWGGMNVVQHDTVGPAQNTFFDVVDTAQVWEFTGVVDEFFTSTQLNLVTNPPIPVTQIGGQLPKRPEPIELTIGDFYTPQGTYNFNAEKYEGMYVILRNVISSDRVTSGTGGGNFRINDGQGKHAFVYNQSRYFKTGAINPNPNYQPPLDGSYLEFVRGVVTTRVDGYWIVPIYPGDIGPVLASPPIITTVRRNSALVAPNQAVEVSAKITDLDGTVANATLHYRVNEGSLNTINLVRSSSDTTLFSGTIPGVAMDSALVDFYLRAEDNEGNSAFSPQDTATGKYFYLVLNRPVTIQDAQYSPFGSGFSAYHNYRISLTGVVTADTSDLPGHGSTPLRIYMQNGTGPWSGIQIGTTGNLGNDILNLMQGDNVTLHGLITESFNVTRIDSITQINVNSSNNPLPEPAVISTGIIGTLAGGVVQAEQWESVLIQYNNAVVTDDNADGNSGIHNPPANSNHGEIFVNDGTGNTRVELQDGNHSYHNFWDSTLASIPGNIRVTEGGMFQELKGIMYFSFSFYKLAPRKDSDFVGYSVNVEDEYGLPVSYRLNQNYPNPFNPSTTISYTIPKEGLVNLKIYNILGQEVKTLLSEHQAPGTYKISFDASALPSGVYFYGIQVGEFSQVKKMMLIK